MAKYVRKKWQRIQTVSSWNLHFNEGVRKNKCNYILDTTKYYKERKGCPGQRQGEASNQKRPRHRECVSKGLTRTGLRAQQRSGESISPGRKNSRCTGSGAGTSQGLGKEQKGLCDCRRERRSKMEDEARKGGRGHTTSGLKGLGSMAKLLELKCDLKPWTRKASEYRGAAQSHLGF